MERGSLDEMIAECIRRGWSYRIEAMGSFFSQMGSDVRRFAGQHRAWVMGDDASSEVEAKDPADALHRAMVAVAAAKE